jgi:hypothetical protein
VQANRETEAQTRDAVKRQLDRAQENRGWTMEDMLADFHLLLFLSDFFPIHEDMPLIVQSVVDKAQPLSEGFKLMLEHLISTA